MNHPLSFIHKWNRKPIFVALLILSLLLFAGFQFLNSQLITSAAPLGLVSHELAWTVTKSQSILASWAGRPSLAAAFSLGLDYIFMLSYGFMFALGALLAAGRHSGVLRRAGIWVTYLTLAAVGFDALENIGQARQLLSGVVTTPLVLLTSLCASLKFGLLAIVILYLLAGSLLPRNR